MERDGWAAAPGHRPQLPLLFLRKGSRHSSTTALAAPGAGATLPLNTMGAPLAVASAMASAIARVAPAKASNSKTPAGPFQTMVREERIASR